jgi:hypothetical protein
MVAQHDVIDLDGHHEPAALGGDARDRVAARRRLVLRLTAAFAAGAVLGGVAVGQWRDVLAERERNATVVFMVTPGSIGRGSSDSKSAQLSGQLTVFNAGPAPVTVREASAQRPGMRIRKTGQPQVVAPSGIAGILVEMQFGCPTLLGPEPLQIGFTVETADKQVREVQYAVTLVGSAWEREAWLLCTPAELKS